MTVLFGKITQLRGTYHRNHWPLCSDHPYFITHNIKIVFVSPQFSQNGAKTISKSINGTVEVIDPLALKWNENLIKVAKDIAKTYK